MRRPGGLQRSGSGSGGGGASAPFSDATALVRASADGSKLFRMNVSGLAGGTTRTATPPGADGQLATTDDLADLTNVLYYASSSVATSQTNNLPAGTLGAIGQGVDVRASGIGPGSSPQITIGGTVALVAVGTDAPGRWRLEGEIMRTSATTVVFSGKLINEGIDADVGSPGENFVERYTEITVADLDANALAVTVNYAITTDAARRVNTLLLLKIGGGSGGGSGDLNAEGVSPLYLPHPAAHFSAFEEGITSAGGPPPLVSAWGDCSGNARDAVQATGAKQPAYLADAGDGRPSIGFDGVDDILVNATAGGTFTGTKGEAWAVVRVGSVVGTHTIFGTSDQGSGVRTFALWIKETGGSSYLGLYKDDNDATPTEIRGSTALVAGRTYVVRWRSIGSYYEIWVNGVRETLTVVAGADDGDWWGDVSARDNFTIGGLLRSTEGIYADVELRELILWDNAVLNTVQATACARRFGAQCGVSVA